MNSSEEKNNIILSLILPEKIIDDVEEKNFIDYLNTHYDSEELKRVIEKKIISFTNEEFTLLSECLEEKINSLLMHQEEIYIKNEMLKLKVLYLEKYLMFYCKRNNIDYNSIFV